MTITYYWAYPWVVNLSFEAPWLRIRQGVTLIGTYTTAAEAEQAIKLLMVRPAGRA